MNNAYKLISKYRSELMGFAILWVVFFHSKFPIPKIYAIKTFKDLGYGGVDIFLFVSGIGICNSLSKNDMTTYIKNRLRRIVPLWWCNFAVFAVFGYFILGTHLSLIESIGYLSFTGFWARLDNQGTWYVYAIMLLYILSPVIYALFKESKNKLNMCIILVSIALIISITFFNTIQLIAVSRFPIYIVGCYFFFSQKEKILSKKDWFICIAIFLISLVILLYFVNYQNEHLWHWGLWWYPFLLITPTLSLLLCKLMSLKIKPMNFILRILRIFGNSSLEILLVTDYLFVYTYQIVNNLPFHAGKWIVSNWTTNIFSHFQVHNIVEILAFVVGVLLGILVHKIFDFVLKKLFH